MPANTEASDRAVETYRVGEPSEDLPSRLCLACLHAHHRGACPTCGRHCGARRVARIAAVMTSFAAFLALLATFFWMRGGGGGDLPPLLRFAVGVALGAIVLGALLARALGRRPIV